METKAFHDNRFDSIQALRGLSTLFIILEHVRFLNCGAFGVDIFFCISGFMIMFSTHKSSACFLRKRLIRILPLYYLMTFGTYFLLLLFPSMFAQSTAKPEFLIKSLLFIPFDIGNGILQPIMRIGWTVNCEIFFYLIFFIALHISHRYRGLISSLMLGGIVLVTALLPASVTESCPFLRFYGDSVMLEFVLGILCYYAARGIYALFQANRIPRMVSILSLCIAACIFVLLVATKPGINILGYRRFVFWGIPAMLMVLLVFTAGLWLKMPRLFVRLGDMSFSIYLMHYYPVMFLDRKIFDFSTGTPYAVLGVLISVAISILLAYVSWIVVEKKVTKWLLGKITPGAGKNR